MGLPYDLGSRVVSKIGNGDCLESKSEKGSWSSVICQTSIGNIAQDPEQFRNNRILDKLEDTHRGWGERKRDPSFGIHGAPFNPQHLSSGILDGS